jgi:hypothetical protein
LTEANKLFEAGRVGEARAKLAARKVDLKRTETLALAAASAAPTAAAPRRASRSLDKDFDDQFGAVAQAEQNFAAGPSAAPVPGGLGAGGGGRFAPPPPQQSREGKAQVRANQQKASDLGF